VPRRPRPHAIRPLVCALAVATVAACTSSPAPPPPATGTGAAALPSLARVVIVIEENHAYDPIIGSGSAPYLNTLASSGALMTNSYAITHPSEPNYLALFAGDTFGLFTDACPVDKGTTANLASELLAAGQTFTGYAESLPAAGYTGCTGGEYARKHAPWADFSNVPAADSRPFSAFPRDYASLPRVSFVIPNLLNDMHDGSVAQGDAWLKANLSAYATWATTHDSLLIVTWDEDNDFSGNHIPTIVYGAHVATGRYSETINHFSMLRTLEALFHLPYLGGAAHVATIADIWH
jgi:phosphatidylinositol-3-phosphatase